MVGNVGSVSVRLGGQSPIDGFAYGLRLDVSAQSVREQLAQAAGLPNLMAGPGSTLVSSERADFLLVDAPAGAQFDALQAFLFSTDQHEIERRAAQLQAQIEALLARKDDAASDSWLDSVASWLGDKVSRAWNALPAPVRGVLKAVGKAAVAVAVVVGVAALVVALSPVELTVGTVALVIGGALLLKSFVGSLIDRRREAKATGQGGTLGVIGAAFADATGVSGVYEAVTDQSILSGTPLNRSEEDRWEAGVTGGIQVVATAFGAKAALERASAFARPSVTPDPSLPAGVGETDAFGNVRYSTQGTAADQALARYHEGVHSSLSPKFWLLRNFRARLGMSAYEKSALLQYVEEALAETYAQMKVNGLRGIPKGLRFPIDNGYVALRPVVTEAAIGTVVYGGIVYGVYVLMSDDSDEGGKSTADPTLQPVP